MNPWFLFVLMTLTAYRIYRLIGLDTITAPVRDGFIRRRIAAGRLTSKLDDWISCPWCAGFWISVAVVGIVAQIENVPLPVLQAAAASCIVGLIGGNLDG